MILFDLNQEQFLQGIEVGRRLKSLRLPQVSESEDMETENTETEGNESEPISVYE